MAEPYLRPEQAARQLGITTLTLYRWARAGKINFIKTPGGQHRYSLAGLRRPEEDEKDEKEYKQICYARVSSASQKEDLERQVESLRSKYPQHEIIQDVGSGLNFKRKGFKAILGLAFERKLRELVVTYKDRLCRFGFELVSDIVRRGGGKIVVLNCEEEQTPEQELCQDLIAITTVFTARIHGFRSGKGRKARREKGGDSDKGKGQSGSGKMLANKNLSRGKRRLDPANTPAKPVDV